MKIGFNILPLKSGHKFRGIGGYTQNLLDNLKKSRDITIVEFTDIQELDRVDLVHYPYFDLFSHSLPLIKKYPTVVTIFDVIPLIYPMHYPSGLKGKINLNLQKIALKNISGVITISETSKKDINKYLKVPLKRIKSIYLAASDEFKPIKDLKVLNETKIKYKLPDKFVIYVGNVNWNKNLIGVAEGCIKAGIDLVLIGKSFTQNENLNHPELRSFKDFLDKYANHPLIHILGYVETDDLVRIANLAEVWLYPSFYEGFGLPILEAQSVGVPVITSQTSSMREITENGAMLIDPESAAEIAQAIRKVVSDKNLKIKLIEEGFKNIKSFSWEKTATETIEFYEEVLKGV